MKSGKSWWAIIGAIVLESIWIIDLAIELYTGEVTYTELIITLAFCVVLAGLICSIFRRKRQKDRVNRGPGGGSPGSSETDSIGLD